MPAPRQAQGAHPLTRAASEPLWAQLLADLRRRVASGAFTTGFPGELGLVEEYAVSRHTVREALRHLRAEGVVSSARGRRPRLGPAEVEQPLGVLGSLFTSVEEAGLEQRSVVRSLDVRSDGTVAARLGLEESTPLVFLERLRLAGDEPLALDRVWLPHALAAPLLEVDFTRTALYAELLAHCGIALTGAQEQVRAVVPNAGEKVLLQVPADVALLAVERLGLLDDRPVEVRRTLVRGDRYALTSRLTSTLSANPFHPLLRRTP